MSEISKETKKRAPRAKKPQETKEELLKKLMDQITEGKKVIEELKLKKSKSSNATIHKVHFMIPLRLKF